jgi:hypothetical protein
MTVKDLRLASDQPTMAALRSAVCDFLQEVLLEVHRVNIIRLAPVDVGEGGWEAEAEVWQPNPTVRSLNLATQRPVLDKELYLVRLDGRLNVTAYGLKESVSL